MTKGIDCIGIAVVYFCHNGKGKVIMGKRSTNSRDEIGRWDVGGGSLEQGENIIETLYREIKEEYGTDVLEHQFLGYRDVHRTLNGQRTHWITLDFAALVDESMMKNGEPHKFDAVEWFTLETIPGPDQIHSQLPTFLKLYRDKLVEL